MRLKQAIVWILLVGLIVEIGAEASSRHCFHKSLTSLTEAMRVELQAGRKLRHAEPFRLISGWPSSSQKSNSGGTQTEYRWHSFVWDLRIQLQCDAEGAIDAITIGSGSVPLLRAPLQTIQQLTVDAPPPDQRPVRGMSAAGPRAFVLEQRGDGFSQHSTERGRLFGEVVRQALLNTARDERGLQTRDATLGDLMPDDENAAFSQFAVITAIDAQRRMQFDVERQHADGRPSLVASFRFQLSPGPLIEELVARMDAMTTYELPRLLMHIGYSGAPHRHLGNGKITEETSRNLDEFGILSQFAAVRALHSQIYNEGESSARLTALARGYAQLAALCRYLSSPAANAFGARGLLYTEHYRRLALGGSFAHWQRGYVRALVGLHASALDDLKRALDESGGAPPPDWSAAIEAFCRGDPDESLGRPEPPSVHKLQCFLRLLAVGSDESPAVRLESAALMLSVQPDCELAFDVALDNAAPEIQSRMSVQAIERFSARLRDYLRSNADIPDDIRELADGPTGTLESEFRFQSRTIAAMRQAGSIDLDGGEPSLAVLAHLIDEIRFAQVCRLLYREKFPVAVAPAHFWPPLGISGQVP